MKINQKYAVLSGIAVLVFAVGVFWYTDAVAPTRPVVQVAPQTAQVSLTIDGLYNAKQVSITQDQTVLSVLQTLNASDPQLQLSLKVYAGLGTLVVGMHGIANGTGKKYWQYKVNDVMPQIGADQYKLQSGDTVDWFFGASQE